MEFHPFLLIKIYNYQEGLSLIQFNVTKSVYKMSFTPATYIIKYFLSLSGVTSSTTQLVKNIIEKWFSAA